MKGLPVEKQQKALLPQIGIPQQVENGGLLGIRRAIAIGLVKESLERRLRDVDAVLAGRFVQELARLLCAALRQQPAR